MLRSEKQTAEMIKRDIFFIIKNCPLETLVIFIFCIIVSNYCECAIKRA
jgi:hypothetical protein